MHVETETVNKVLVASCRLRDRFLKRYVSGIIWLKHETMISL